MVKKGEKSSSSSRNPAPRADPETLEKKRLRSLAISRGLLRRGAPVNPAASLPPSAAAVKLDGRDIVKRGQRKSRYLFSFPGLLAPLSAGRVGELADLATRNPLLYLDFPQGRMKLFGTHVYPKNRYLSLQLTKSAKGVVCEDSFDSMIVFSDAWWIGLKEENPEELQLDFPKEFNEGKHVDCDFKGGAGAASEEASGGNRSGKEYIEPLSPDIELDDDMLEKFNTTIKQDTKNLMDITPVRQSARTAGKVLRYAESSSEDDPISSDAEVPEAIDEKVEVRSGNAARRSIFGKTEDSSPATSDLVASESEFVGLKNHSTGKTEQSSLSSEKSKEKPPSGGTLIQATLSTLFEKVAGKKSKRSADDSLGPKGSSSKRQRLSPKQITDQVQVKGSNKKAAGSSGKKGTGIAPLRKQTQVEDDEIEDISSESQDGSDDDWLA